MLDDALSLSLSLSLTLYLSPYLPLSFSLSLSEIYAQPPVDGGTFLTSTTTQDGILSPVLLYVYMIIRTTPHGEENIGIN